MLQFHVCAPAVAVIVDVHDGAFSTHSAACVQVNRILFVRNLPFKITASSEEVRVTISELTVPAGAQLCGALHLLRTRDNLGRHLQ